MSYGSHCLPAPSERRGKHARLHVARDANVADAQRHDGARVAPAPLLHLHERERALARHAHPADDARGRDHRDARRLGDEGERGRGDRRPLGGWTRRFGSRRRCDPRAVVPALLGALGSCVERKPTVRERQGRAAARSEEVGEHARRAEEEPRSVHIAARCFGGLARVLRRRRSRRAGRQLGDGGECGMPRGLSRARCACAAGSSVAASGCEDAHARSGRQHPGHLPRPSLSCAARTH